VSAVAEIAGAIDPDATREGQSSWRCRCPVHGGRSLRVSEGRKVPIVFKCFGGCGQDDLVNEPPASSARSRARQSGSRREFGKCRGCGMRVPATTVPRAERSLWSPTVLGEDAVVIHSVDNEIQPDGRLQR
jgi:hypothetical protein